MEECLEFRDVPHKAVYFRDDGLRSPQKPAHVSVTEVIDGLLCLLLSAHVRNPATL